MKPLLVGTQNELNRDIWIKRVLNSLPEGARILDAGAGEQQYRKYCTHLDYVSQDFAGYDPKNMEKHGLQMNSWNYGKLDIVSDIASIPEADASFDAIMCTEVFEHIMNPKEAIVEFTRLLKPGGYLLITAPFCSITHFAPYHFYTGFNSFFYDSTLSNDYEIIEMDYNGNYFEYLAQELRRLEYIGERYANIKISRRHRFSINRVLKFLDHLSTHDKGSRELLCFGIHILAKKK